LSIVLIATSSKAIAGMFSARCTSPTWGSAGMIISGGPSLPASQLPRLLSLNPFSS